VKRYPSNLLMLLPPTRAPISLDVIAVSTEPDLNDLHEVVVKLDYTDKGTKEQSVVSMLLYLVSSSAGQLVLCLSGIYGLPGASFLALIYTQCTTS
jgi:hypothetical protein